MYAGDRSRKGDTGGLRFCPPRHRDTTVELWRNSEAYRPDDAPYPPPLPDYEKEGELLRTEQITSHRSAGSGTGAPGEGQIGDPIGEVNKDIAQHHKVRSPH